MAMNSCSAVSFLTSARPSRARSVGEIPGMERHLRISATSGCATTWPGYPATTNPVFDNALPERIDIVISAGDLLNPPAASEGDRAVLLVQRLSQGAVTWCQWGAGTGK